MADITKEELFSEVKALEAQAFSLIDDDSRSDEFDKVIRRTEELTKIAKRNGWAA